MTAVVSVARAQHALAELLLPNGASIRHGAHRSYLLYQAVGTDLSLTDPTDGALLVEMKFFRDESGALAWIAADIAGRGVQ
jgi:hypothetical protein